MVEPPVEQPGPHLVNLPELLEFSDHGPQARLLFDSQEARLVGFALRAGQEIPGHRSPSQLLVQVIQGNLIFTVADQPFALHPGMVLQVAPNIQHNLRATEDTLMLLTMTPSPAYVHARIKEA